MLSTAEPMLFHHYTQWLLGPEDLDKTANGPDGRPKATPALQHVLGYEVAVCEKMFEHMIENMLETICEVDFEIRLESMFEIACEFF